MTDEGCRGQDLMAKTQWRHTPPVTFSRGAGELTREASGGIPPQGGKSMPLAIINMLILTIITIMIMLLIIIRMT